MEQDLFTLAELIMFRETHSVDELCYKDLIEFIEESPEEEERPRPAYKKEESKVKDESEDYEDEVFEEENAGNMSGVPA